MHKDSKPLRPAPGKTASPFWKRVLRAIPIMVLLALLMLLFGHAGVLHKLEPVVLSAQMIVEQRSSESPVAIVIITDEDFKNERLFDGTRPLNDRVLAELIGDIAKGDPSVIGVDIDTSARQYRNLKLGSWKPHIVWEREVREIPENLKDSKQELEAMPVLGGKSAIDATRNTTGLGLMIDDGEDGVTRRYRRTLETRTGDLPSFAWAIVQAYRDAMTPERDVDDRFIRFSAPSRRLMFTASKVRELAKGWPESSPIRGKVVLLGGSYLGEDLHQTPLGRMCGVEVVANVVETELERGGGQKAPGEAVIFLLEIFEGVALLILFHSLALRWAMLASLAVIPLISVTCSYLAYGGTGETWRFAAILFGLLVFELYEHFRRTAVPRVFQELTGRTDQHH